MDISLNWSSKQDLMRSFGISSITLDRIMEQLNSNTDVTIQSHIKNGGYHSLEVLYDDCIVNLIGEQLK